MYDFFGSTPQYPAAPDPLQQQELAPTPEERQGLLSKLYEGSIGGLGYVGKILDKTFGGRAVRGVLGGNLREALSIIPGSDTLGLTSDEDTVQGQDLLTQWGLKDKGTDSFGSSIASLGLEMALDPSTYLGIGPLTKVGKAAALTGDLTKGLSGGIRAGERSLLGFGLPFRQPLESLSFGSGAATADALDAAAKYSGKALSAPLDAAQYLAKPSEAIFGVNPVQKLRDGGQAVGRWGKALFSKPYEGALSSGGQDLALNEFTPAATSFGKPAADLYGDLTVGYDKVRQLYGPEAESAARRATTLGVELPVDHAPFVKRYEEAFNAKNTKLGDDYEKQLINGDVYSDGVQAAKQEYEGHLKRLELSKQYRADNDPVKMLEAHLPPHEVDSFVKKWEDVRTVLDTYVDEKVAHGLKLNELDDYINYLPRQKQELDDGAASSFVKFLSRNGKAGAATADPSNIRRMDGLRGLPGGTDQANQLIKDASLRKIPDDAREGIIRELMTGTTEPAKGSSAWKEAEELSNIIKTAPQEFVDKQLNFFSTDHGKIIRDYGQAQAKGIGMMDTIVGGASRYSLSAAEAKAKGIEGIPVQQILDQINGAPILKTDNVWQSVADKFGVQLKDVGERVIPAEIASDMARMGKSWSSPDALKPIIQTWDSLSQMFKTGVTSPWPGFNVRNYVTGEYNKLRAGKQSLESNHEFLDVMRGGYLPQKTVDALAKTHPDQFANKTIEQATDQLKSMLVSNDLAFTRGSRGTGEVLGPSDRLSQHSLPPLNTDVPGSPRPIKEIATDFVKGFGPTQKAKDAGYSVIGQYLNPVAIEGVGSTFDANRIVAQAHKLGGSTEDYLRGSQFLENLKQGFHPDVASMDVKKYQIDYDNLSQFEKNVMRRFVPFYSFSRRNLPPILEDLASKPALIAQSTRAATGARDPSEFTPQYIAEGASFPLGSPQPGTNRYISSFGLPIEDELIKTVGSALHGDVRRSLQQILGLGNPILKAPYEQAFDTQLFSGRRLSDLDPGKIASLGGLLPDRAAQIASQFISNTPASRAVSSAEKLFDERKGWLPTAINLGTGARISDVDVERSKLAADRTMLMDMLRPSRESKTREELYVPKDKLKDLDPTEALLYQLYLGTNRDLSAHARGTTSTR